MITAMIMPDDNNEDNADDNVKKKAYLRLKRWREKNRALVNLRQREYRKNLSGGVPERGETSISRMLGVRNPDEKSDDVRVSGEPTLPSQTSKDETLAHLRTLIKQEQEKPASEPPATPTVPVGGIYRNDQGGVISKFAWDKLQRLKEKAKQGGYTLDEYSQ